jgi:hypothetical protein
MSVSSNDSMKSPVDSSPDQSFATFNHTGRKHIDIEIVGIYCGSFERSCCSHKTYGWHVVPGDLLHFVQTVVEVNRVVEEAVK